MNDLFHIIEDAHVILLSKGVFRQAKVYWRGDRLYAGWGSGFIRIGGRGETSCPSVSYETLDLPEIKGVRIVKGRLSEPLFVQLESVNGAA